MDRAGLQAAIYVVGIKRTFDPQAGAGPLPLHGVIPDLCGDDEALLALVRVVAHDMV